MSKPYVSNVISHKYDSALDFHVTMYDNLPYQRDSDYCNVEKVALVSGRVIKYYLCFNQTECFEINNKDDVIQDILAQSATVERTVRRKASSITASDDTGVTQEQIQTLLDDKDAVSFDDFTASASEFDETEGNDLDAPANSVNAFADVEDW